MLLYHISMTELLLQRGYTQNCHERFSLYIIIAPITKDLLEFRGTRLFYWQWVPGTHVRVNITATGAKNGIGRSSIWEVKTKISLCIFLCVCVCVCVCVRACACILFLVINITYVTQVSATSSSYSTILQSWNYLERFNYSFLYSGFVCRIGLKDSSSASNIF